MNVGSLAVDMTIITGILGITEVVKKRLKVAGGWIVLVPLVLGLAIGIVKNVGKPWHEMVLQGFVYCAIAAYLHDTGRAVIKNRS